MSEVQYTQVELRKGGDEHGDTTQVVWIPSQFAKVGRHLQLKKADDTWDDGWVVVERYSSQPGSALEQQRRTRRDWFSDQEIV